MYLYAEHILTVDLEAATTSVAPYDDRTAEEVVGGAALAERLLAEHADRDPVVLSTGPLTGTLTPAGALGLISALGSDGAPVHVPLTLFMGSELKYSGFDAVVVLGASAEPVYLWLHDGIATLEGAADLWGLDTWQTSDAVKAAKGDEVVQVLAVGPAGERGLPAAQVVANYWSTADDRGLGARLGVKKLKAVAMRGLGIIDVEEAEDLFEHCLALGETAAGFDVPGDVIAAGASASTDATACRDWLAPVVHRHRGCFSCRSLCFTYVKYDEPADEMRSTDVAEPGCLLTDAEALLTLFRAGFSAAEAGRLLAGAARRGLEPAAVAAAAAAAGATAAAEGLAAADETAAEMRPVERDVPPADDRIRAAYVLGVCPVFMRTAAAPDTEALVEAVRLGTGMELDTDGLLETTSTIASALPPRVV